MYIPTKNRDAFTKENAQEEIVADFFAQILFQGEKYRTRIIEALQNADGEAFIGIGDEISSEAALLELQQKEPTLFEQVVQWIKEIIYKLRGMPQAKSVADDLVYIEGLLTRVYNSKDSKRLMKKKAAEEKYSLNKNFGIQLQDWLNGGGKKYRSYNGEYFELGTTPDVLVKHGAPSSEVIMYNDVVVKITGGKHNISLDEISKLPSQLNDPILLFKGSVPNSFVALTELKDKNGNDIIVAVHIGKKHHRTTVNKIASIYSKSDDFGNNKIQNYVMSQINNGNLIDASNKKAPKWFTTKGLQLPKVVQTILDANNKISQNNSVVNTNSMQNEENNTEKSNDNSNDTPSGQYSLGSPMQQMRYNAEAYAKHINRKYQSKADKDSVAKKIKQIVAQDNKSQKAQEETRQKVYDRKGNLVGELTLKERLINEVAVEIAESIEAPRTAEADEVLSALKERPLVINEKQEAEIKHQFGTLTNFRKDTGIRLVSESNGLYISCAIS